MAKPINHAGKTFGNWTVIEYLGKQYWLCRCSCGNMKSIYSGNLVSGNTTQCRSCSAKSKKRKDKPRTNRRKPIKPRAFLTIDGETKPKREWQKIFRLSRQGLEYRIKHNKLLKSGL